ncbi:MAG TPA: aminotransferase class I/II-fold pyridoxal phosphate-dependent enzyme [Candidatus Limnocylindria bacterium]|nr:aminotransferase class I/II-fold pyridoxal phosphate-dependent enzyme [Candidatus Limnocylindria bacterium]
MDEQPDPWEGPDTLGLDAEEMRRLGHWLVDAVVEHREGLRREPAIRTGAPAELLEALGGPVPEEPGDGLSAMKLLVEGALRNMQHGDHPRYFARVPGPSSFAGVLGEWLGTGFNTLVASWAGGSGPATVELVVIDWLRQLLGMPEGCEGVLLSGGSLANLTGLAAARAACGAGVAYLSDQTHASVGRGLRTLGFPAAHVRVLESDEDFRLMPAAVSRAVAEDRRAGLDPRFVVATAGTTNTGAVDPLGELSRLCRTEGLWLHVDGAYGAPAALCDAGRGPLRGLELADSMVLDPHKWLFAPYDVGCLLVRRPGVLARAFAMHPEYLADVTALRGEVDFRDRSPELSRRSRALKLWLVFRVYGAARIRAAIARGIALAEFAQGRIEADPRWELVTPAQLGILTFALAGASGEEHVSRADALTHDGYAAVSTTVLRGRSVLRLCTINPLSTEEELVSTLERLGSQP